jgi:hypothetical protein
MENFDVHKFFKKQYLTESLSDKEIEQRIQHLKRTGAKEEPLRKLAAIGKKNVNENSALNKRSDAYFKELVPSSGNSNKLEGEMLRAINRIIYRHYNDGDFFDRGYGIETAGPAHSFLVNSREIPFEIQQTITSILSKAEGLSYKNNDDGYERLMYLALEKILDYIDSKDGVYTDNKDDIFNYKSEFEDLDDGEDEYDDYDDSDVDPYDDDDDF